MSDLKYQTVDELENSKIECENYISKLQSDINGQKTRLEWINKYLFEKTPQELSINQIEKILGHKLIIKQGE